MQHNVWSFQEKKIWPKRTPLLLTFLKCYSIENVRTKMDRKKIDGYDDDGIRFGKKNQLKSVSFCEKQLAYINQQTIWVCVCVCWPCVLISLFICWTIEAIVFNLPGFRFFCIFHFNVMALLYRKISHFFIDICLNSIAQDVVNWIVAHSNIS